MTLREQQLMPSDLEGGTVDDSGNVDVQPLEYGSRRKPHFFEKWCRPYCLMLCCLAILQCLVMYNPRAESRRYWQHEGMFLWFTFLKANVVSAVISVCMLLIVYPLKLRVPRWCLVVLIGHAAATAFAFMLGIAG